MHEIIDLSAYRPTQTVRIRPKQPKKGDIAETLMLAFEAVVTGIIAISIMVGITAFALML